MKKAIQSKYTESVTVIERAEWSISFYDVETSRHYERRVWHPVHGSDIYVQHRGGFYIIATEYNGKYDPQAISRYEAVSAEELETMAAEVIAHRAGKQYADDLTWEEVTRVYAYAVICNDADTEATMTAIVNSILQDRSKQPTQQATEATKNAARWADLAEQAAQDVETAATICDADAADNRAQMYAAAAAEQATRYDADDATARHAARAAAAAETARATLITRVQSGITNEDADAIAGSDYAEALTIEAAGKAGIDPDRIRYATTDDEADAATETSADHAETYADAAEYAERNATAAEARAFADYAAEAARDAARTARYHRCHCYRDHDTSAYAARAVEIEAEQVQRAEAAADRAAAAAARAEHRALTSKANAAALALLNAYAEAIGEYPAEDDPETRAAYAVAHGAIAHVIGSTRADDTTVSNMVEAIANRAREDAAAHAETYQRAELLDYLGDATAYDLAAIEAEATETDPATGRQVWRRGADLAAIAERNELSAYYPATA